MNVRRVGLWFITFLIFPPLLTANKAIAQNIPGDHPAIIEPSPDPSPNTSPTPGSVTAKKFLLNVLSDQTAIWLSPFALKRSDKRWIAPLGLSTILLLSTDRHSAAELTEGGGHPIRVRWSRDFSQIGALYTAAGVGAGFYLYGRTTHNERARETGLLAAEALINAALVTEALKQISNRPRPLFDNGRGDFLDGGNSFPSGHATTAWTLATVVAMEYHDRPLIKWGAYGLATAVSIARYTGRNHFPSDVLIGSALGFGIGRYVFKTRHDRALDSNDSGNVTRRKHSRWAPSLTPVYSRGAHLYGAQLNWPL